MPESEAALLAIGVTGSGLRHRRESGDVVDRPGRPLRIVRTLSNASLGLARPQAATIGPNGNLYITDSAHQTVTEATPAGRVIRTWGGEGTQPGKFRLRMAASLSTEGSGLRRGLRQRPDPGVHQHRPLHPANGNLR